MTAAEALVLMPNARVVDRMKELINFIAFMIFPYVGWVGIIYLSFV